MKKERLLTTEDLKVLSSGETIKLDCGRRATIGHHFANTVIIVSRGGGEIRTLCPECGY